MKANEERTWSFGPGGSRSSDNWMGDDRPRKPTIVVSTKGENPDEKLLKAEFKDKFPSIPDVEEIDGGFAESVHQRAERVGRDEAIEAYAGGAGENFIAVYWADRQNPSGPEYHWITDNGIIVITNADKMGGKRIVTKLIARPGQLRRYPNNELMGDPKYARNVPVDAIQVYPYSGKWQVPRDVLDLARLHQELGLNYSE